MPSSTNRHLSNATEAIRTSDAKSVLDIGVGCGKWGLLCREYLDIFQGRTKPDEWQTEIVGIEAYYKYLEFYPWLDRIYNDIYWQRAERALPMFDQGAFDLIIASDVIERLTSTVAYDVLKRVSIVAAKRLIISIPIGLAWLESEVPNDNELEKYRSAWTPKQVIDAVAPGFVKHTVEMIFEAKGPVGLFVFDK